MLSRTLEFFSLSDPNVRYVVLGTVLLGISAAVVGCFTFLRKRALLGDAVAHSILPGVAMAFIIAQTKSPLILLAGAFVSGWLSLLSIDIITHRSRLKPDTAIGLVLSVFFGIGILLLTSIQQSGNASQAGLDKFLFGNAASMIGSDVYTFAAVCVVLIGAVALFFKEFTLLSFDRAFAVVSGQPVRLLEFILATITVLAIATGIQAVGVVLMAALLITPATAARYWTHNLKHMVILAAAAGALAGVFGAYISYLYPSMPTGPWIVVFLSVLAFFSLLAAPKRGIWHRYSSRQRTQRKMLEENILKEFYHLGEIDGQFAKARSLDDIIHHRRMKTGLLRSGIQKLIRKGFLLADKNSWQLTESGKTEGQRITRLHRLWEVYLTTYVRIAPDHVHDDAEAIEHFITPELEERLEAILQYPEHDPHQTKIPR